MKGAASTLHLPTPVISPEALQAIQLHSWPGNVRELENCLTRAVVVSTGNVIRPEHLAIGPAQPGEPESFATLDEHEKSHLLRVLMATGGRKAKTARILGISRPRLNRLMEKYSIGSE